MSKGNTFETDLIGLIFNATPIANLADDAASGPLTDLYVSLHTADPGEGGSQTTSEANYGSYARVAVPRDNTGWTVASGGASNAGVITFAMSGSGTNVITYFGVGTASGGAGKLLYSGLLTTPLSVVVGIQPRFDIGGLAITED